MMDINILFKGLLNPLGIFVLVILMNYILNKICIELENITGKHFNYIYINNIIII